MDDLDPSDFANLRVDVVEEKLGAREQAKQEGKKQSKKAAPPKEPASMPIPPKSKAQEKKEMEEQKEDFKRRQKLLDKIMQYREKFGVKKRNNVGIKSSMEELLDEVHYIQQQLGEPDEGADNPACMALIATMFGMEYMHEQQGWNPMGLKLRGLGQTTQVNIEHFEPLLEEFMIKHGHSLVMSVEWRLCLMIGTTVMTVHSANNGMEWPGKIIAAQQLAEQQMAANALGEDL